MSFSWDDKHKKSDNTAGKGKKYAKWKADHRKENAQRAKRIKSSTKHSWQDGVID